MIRSTSPSRTRWPAVVGLVLACLVVGLVASDTRAQPAALVRDITPGSTGTSFGETFNVNGTLVFVVEDSVSGRELWRSDGTAAGTVLLKDIYPGAQGSYPDFFAQVNGTLYFAAVDPTYGSELWKTDGTTAGTVLVKDINTSGFSSPRQLDNVDGTLYFLAYDTAWRYWKSDGTAAGTVPFWTVPLPPGGSVCAPPLFGDRASIGSTLYFSFCHDSTGRELWKTNGTGGGTVLVKDIYPGAGSSEPVELFEFNGLLVFGAEEGSNGRELWKSDGSAAGTQIVKDIYPGTESSFAMPGMVVAGTLFFLADDGTHGLEPWKSDGTSAGTVLVKDVIPGASGMVPSGENAVGVIGANIYFAIDDGVHGAELWKSDGTSAGTVLVKDIVPGLGNGAPDEFVVLGDLLFFAATDGASGRELWKSDGEGAGTVLASDINPGGAGSSPDSLTEVNGKIFFTADDGTHGRELWKVSVQVTPWLAPIPTLLPIGTTTVVMGTGFTAGTVIKLYVATAGGAVTYGPYIPTAWTSTSLTWAIPASVPLGNGFGSVQVVNTDQGYTESNIVGALLEGDPADNIPTILYLNGEALGPPDPSIGVAHVDTVLAKGSTVTITGTGFNIPGVNLFTATGNAGPLWPTGGWSSTQFQVQVPVSAPTGPGNFQVVNSPYTGNVTSNAVSAVIGARPTITHVSVVGSTVTVTGTGFCSLSVINLFNLQGATVVNLGGLNGPTPKVALTIVNDTQFTFTVPAGAVAGPAFVEVLNPPYIPYASSGNDPDGAFTIP